MKHCVILGTRPEIVKLSSTIRYLQQTNRDFFVVHTNQHYSPEMDEVFFRELELPSPKINLHIGSGSHAQQTAKMLIGIEQALTESKPDVVYVQGDTNTVLAGALTASKLQIPVAHVEAGLRSYDRTMPEELNRIIADHVSRFLFAPTNEAVTTLRKEGITHSWITNVGNPIVDAIAEGLRLLKQSKSQNKHDKPYFLLTLHRPANVDNENIIKEIWSGLRKVSQQHDAKIIFPVHPRTSTMIKKYNLEPFPGLEMIEPCGFLDMLSLEQNSQVILTDSGGIQEEACILSKPTVTIRDNTERPETVRAGGNILAGRTAEGIQQAVATMMNVKVQNNHPYGKGNSGETMVKIVEKDLADA